jgi:lysyl-tRNA synthetase, class I
MLIRALEKYDDVMGVMLPTLGAERQATYSPFLPISPKTGRVLYVPMKRIDAKAGTITFDDEDGAEVTMPVGGGRTKLQWKPDFGMRFAALGVDYEMFGKDHQSNAPIYDKICEILGVPAPLHYVYELFLDEKGEKISKTKGNGITIEQWLTYASPESLSLFMYSKPRAAKKLHFDVIPRAVDDYLTFLSKVGSEDGKARLDNPVWHIHSGTPPAATLPISFALLLNLVSVSNTEDKSVLWGFIRRYAPDATPQTQPILDKLAGYAINYYRDFEMPLKKFRVATGIEINALKALDTAFAAAPATATASELQDLVYAAGKDNGYTKENLRAWFQAIYEVLLGTSQGPRFGSFVQLYGIKETRALIAKGLAGGLLA